MFLSTVFIYAHIYAQYKVKHWVNKETGVKKGLQKSDLGYQLNVAIMKKQGGSTALPPSSSNKKISY